MSRALVLDTNLLLLYLAGITERRGMAAIKRLSAYSVADFDRLAIIVSQFRQVILTPNTITETSNLLRTGARTRVLAAMTQQMHLLLDRWSETYIPSKQAVARPESAALGVTDAVLLTVAESGAMLLTADFDLYGAAMRAKLAAINFAHLPRT